jgi:predicted enzyme related to lactoylglutathione lyase
LILGLRTAIYPVSDLNSAKDWYSRVLGLTPYFDQPFYVGFAVGGFELGLLPRGRSGTSGAQPLWGVENVDEELARFVGLGGVVLEPVTDVGEGIRVAAIRDPFGNRFGLIENPNFRRDAVR